MNQQNDTIGPWSEDKLKLLRKYLDAYTVIMRGQSCAATAVIMLTPSQAQVSPVRETKSDTLMVPLVLR